MEKVTVKAKASEFDGFLRGYKFFKGEAENVYIADAKFMEKHFGAEIVRPEQPKPKAKAKPKAKPKEKSASKKKDE